MPNTSRSRRTSLLRLLTGGLASALAAAALVIVPSSPAAAIQTMAWTTSPPSTATAGQAVSFAWSGTANTFLGARITGCFANFPEGNNYTNSFGGNFTTGNCNIVNRVIPLSGTYPITVGFTLSTGSQMTMTWNINVAAPTPTIYTTGNVTTTATSEQGAPAFFSAYGADAYYGSYSATCSPASGSMFPPGVSTVQCSATNAGGKTGTSSLTVTVNQATPTLAWNPGQVVAGQPLGSALSATVSPANLTGSLVYTDAADNVLTAGSILQEGAGQVLTATFVPSGPSAAAYTSASATRTVDVVRLPQAVTFGTVPATATVDDAPFDVTATGTEGGGAVIISAAAGSACTVLDGSAGTSGAATVTVTRNGTCVLEADQAETATYSAAPVAHASVTVARRTPVISWTPTDQMTYGATLAGLLDASTDADGTWAYRLDGVVVDGSTVPGAGQDRLLDVVFTPADPDSYTSATASRTLDVLRAAQQLTVDPIADRTYGDAPFDVVVTDEGPGQVSVAVTGPCSVDGRTVTPSGAGDCEVTVAKAEDDNHLPATVVRTVRIAKGQPTLTWSQPGDLAYGDTLGAEELDAVLSAETDDAAAAPVGDLTYTLADGSPAQGAVLEPGDHVLHARWEPTGPSADRWKVVTETVDVIVAPVLPAITWNAPASIVHGTPLGDAQLDATTAPAAATGTIDYYLADGVTPARGAVLGAGQAQQLIAHYQPDAAATGRYLPAWGSVTIDVTRAPQAVVFGDLPTDASVDDVPFDVTATGTEGGGDVAISAAAGSACTVDDTSVGTRGAATVTLTRNGSCVLEARQAQTTSFSASPVVQRSVTVARRTPRISWTPAAEITYGDTLAALLDASTDAPGTWTYRLDGDVVDAMTAPGAGADRQLDVVFTPAEPDRHTTATASRTLTVLRAQQQLAVAPIADRTYGQAAFDVVVTDQGPGQVSVAVTGPCAVDGRIVTPSAAGDCEVTVTKSGDANHVPVTVVRSFHIAKGEPTLTWEQPGAIVRGTPLGDAQLDATAGPADATGPIDYYLADGVTPARGVVLGAGQAQQLIAHYRPDAAAAGRYLPASRTVTIDVTKASQAVAVGALTDKVYGEPDVLLRGSGGASGRSVTFTATGACTVAGNRLTLVRAGTCTVTAGQEGAEDFEPAASVTRTFTIARAALQVVAPSAVRRYAAEQPSLTPSYRGFVNGDDAGDLTTAATCSSTADIDSPAGTYVVTCTGATSPDYAVTTTEGHLRVRYGLRGLVWALDAEGGKGLVEKGSRTPVRLHLRDAEGAVVPRSISAEMGRECRVTLTAGDADRTCFRYDRRADRLVAMLDTHGLARGSVVRVVVKVRAADGTLVRRREVALRVR